MEMTKLHFVRMRHKETRDPFCDPMADIKQVVQQAFQEAPVIFGDMLGPEKTDYLRAYLKVFITRLEEDTLPLADQIKVFEGAMKSKFSKDELDELLRCFALYVLYTFSMHMRRDGAVDAANKTSFRASSALLAISSKLSDKTWQQVREELKDGLMESTDAEVRNVDALCVENDSRTVQNIKDLAALTMGATGSSKWEDVAKACDSYVQTSEGTKDKDIAAALAYPDYASPFFEIEVT